MIKTWIADITPLYEESCYRMYYEKLPDFRKEKADRMRYQNGKAQSAGVWSLLERVRKEYAIEAETAFNLSHSGDYVLCSVDMDSGIDTQVGCDIELVKKADMRIAERFFCTGEYREILRQTNEENIRDAFYRFWVLKESFMKATGRGMALDMKSFEIRLSHPPVLFRKPKEFEREYYYREYEITGVPYKIAACSTDKNIDSDIHTELKF